MHNEVICAIITEVLCIKCKCIILHVRLKFNFNSLKPIHVYINKGINFCLSSFYRNDDYFNVSHLIEYLR